MPGVLALASIFTGHLDFSDVRVKSPVAVRNYDRDVLQRCVADTQLTSAGTGEHSTVFNGEVYGGLRPLASLRLNPQSSLRGEDIYLYPGMCDETPRLNTFIYFHGKCCLN